MVEILEIEHFPARYTCELDDGRTLVWHGGNYIEVGIGDPRTDEFTAGDVINVWDYERSEPEYPFCESGFRRAVEDWLEREREDEEEEEED